MTSVSAAVGATFDHCNVEIKSDIGKPEETIFKGTCTDQDQIQDLDNWTKIRDISKVIINWNAGFDRPKDVPHVPHYVRFFKPGITRTYAELELYNSG